MFASLRSFGPCVRPSAAVTSVYKSSLRSADARTSRIYTARRQAGMDRIKEVLAKNASWCETKKTEKEDFFSRYAHGQWPEFLWIGCADSRVVANDILGMEPGDVFTHRNVGNVVNHSDMNCMSVLDYGIGALKVKHVIVCGHYGCGAVKASLTLPAKTPGVVNGWVANIRSIRNKYADQLDPVPIAERPDLLSEINAIEQMVQVCTSPAVQTAWANDVELYVHCVVYDIATGKLKCLVPAVTSLDDLLALTKFEDGIVSGTGEVKDAFLARLKGQVSLEKATA